MLNTNLRNIIVGCLVLISTSAGYYLFWEIPQQNRAQQQIEQEKIELEKNKIEETKRANSEKERIQSEVILKNQKQLERQKNLLDDCLLQAQGITDKALRDYCPEFFTTPEGGSVNCSNADQIEAAGSLRNMMEEDCYKRYQTK